MTSSVVTPKLQEVPVGLLRWFPAVHSLRDYSWPAARADVVAGFSVATVAVPQAMAYGLVAGVPPEHGLYTAIVMTAVGAFFDSSRQLINGPTNAISIAVLSALAPIEDPAAKLNAAFVLALLIGLLQVGITLFRLGDLTRYISHSVIVGFTAGASMLLVLDQLKNLLGKKAMGDVHDHFLVRFHASLVDGGDVHWPTLAVGSVSAALLIALRWGKRRLGWALFPELLVVVVAVSAATARLGLDGVKVVGTIPAALPGFQLPHADAALVSDLAPSALAIGTLGLLEAISMAKAISAQTRQKLDLNQQCLSEGLANLAGGFFQCIPGSGSLTRSAINQQAGAASQWSGIVSAAAVAVIVLLFAPYAQYIPKSCLAGILMVTAGRMIDPKALWYHVRASRFDAGIVITTALAAVFVSVEFCVLIGVFMSFLLTVPRAGRMQLTEFVVTPERVIHERAEGEPVCDRILLFGLEGELFFGAAANLEAHLEAIEARFTPEVKAVVLRLKRVRNPDAVCLHQLETFLHTARARGVTVLLCGVRDDLHDAMARIGMELDPSLVFREQSVRNTATLLAVRRAYALLDDGFCEHCPRRDPAQREDLYFMI